MEIERIKTATIDNLTSIIKDLKNIELEEQLSYKLNTNNLGKTQFVDEFL